MDLQSAPRRPKVGIAVFTVRRGQVLLGKRKGSHGAALWATPGGHLEFGEEIETCAKRELCEETGLIAHSIRLGPWVNNVIENTKHYVTIFTLTQEFEGEPQLMEPNKCEGWQWFDWDCLPTPLFPSIVSLLEKIGTETLKAGIFAG